MKKKYFKVTFFLLIGILPIAGNAISNNHFFLSGLAEELKVTIDKKDASKKDGDGTIQIKVTGGTAPYNISFFSPYAFPSHTKGDQLTLENIKSGDYLFIIQDKLGNTAIKEVKVEER